MALQLSESRPLSASHTRAVLSMLAVTMRRPSGLYLALKTTDSWPSEFCEEAPAVGLPNPRRLVIARGDDAATIGTIRRAPDDVPMARKHREEAPAVGLHTRAVLSQLAVTMRRPLGLYLALSAFPMALHLSEEAPAVGLPHRAVLSALAVTMRRPSGLGLALQMMVPMARAAQRGGARCGLHTRAVLSPRSR